MGEGYPMIERRSIVNQSGPDLSSGLTARTHAD